jgi:ribosomal protein S18 acetylase RimI-like enzyme
MECWPEAERAAQRESLQRLTQADSGGFLLFSATRESRLLGALLAQALPGNSATFWPPQLTSGETDPRVCQSLLSAAEQMLAGGGTKICQALLSKNQESAAATLASAGFHNPADLLYMTCEADHFPPTAPEFDSFQLRNFEPGREEELAALIDETYVGTLDCPSMNGLRDTRDVVAGYEHVGDFRPDRWLLLESTAADTIGNKAGCLLLARHAAHRTMELIYVGITPSFRQRGLGRRLTQHAQWLAGQDQCQRLVLAVDAANAPAIEMYAAAGFWAWDERAIWLKCLSLSK